MTHKRNLLIFTLSLAISALFLFLAFRNLHPEDVLRSLAEVSVPLVLVGIGVYMVAALLIAWRWQFLLNPMRHVPLRSLYSYVLAGYMGNNIYPFRAGEALRIYLLWRDWQVGAMQATTTVVVERAMDGIVMLTFILLGLVSVPVIAPEVHAVAQVALPLFVVVVMAFFALAYFHETARRIGQSITNRLPQRLGARLYHLGDEFLKGLEGLRTPEQLSGMVIASYASWAVEAAVYALVAEAFGLDLSYGAMLLVVGTVNLAGLIPASPGQVGVYEFFVSAVLIGLGIPQETALAYAIVVHLVIWIPVTVSGLIVLAQRGLSLAAVQQARQEQAQGKVG